MRADLKRLKRETESRPGTAGSSGAVAAAPDSGSHSTPQPASSALDTRTRTDSHRLAVATESANSVSVSPPATSTRKYVFAALAVLVVALAAAGIWYWRAHQQGSAAQIESIAVIPFASAAGNADADLLSDGLTESLIDSLAHVPNLKVKSRNSVFHYKGKEVDVQRVGKDLTVDALSLIHI